MRWVSDRSGADPEVCAGLRMADGTVGEYTDLSRADKPRKGESARICLDLRSSFSGVQAG
jgi:hypothetical protein